MATTSVELDIQLPALDTEPNHEIQTIDPAAADRFAAAMEQESSSENSPIAESAVKAFVEAFGVDDGLDAAACPEDAKPAAAAPTEDAEPMAAAPAKDAKPATAAPTEDAEPMVAAPTKDAKPAAAALTEDAEPMAAAPAKDAKPVVAAPTKDAKPAAPMPTDDEDKASSDLSDRLVAAGVVPQIREMPQSAVEEKPVASVSSAPDVRAAAAVDGVARVASPADVLVQAAEAVAEAILVSPDLSYGQGEIRIQLKPDVLDGSEVRIRVSGNNLGVELMPLAPDTVAFIERNLPQLQQMLVARVHSYSVGVSVRRSRVGRA